MASILSRPQWFNSLAPGRCGSYLELVIFKLISRIAISSICCGIASRWMLKDLTDDLSALVQVMAWNRPATSHYLSQCWSRSRSPYGITRPQWVNVECSTLIGSGSELIWLRPRAQGSFWEWDQPMRVDVTLQRWLSFAKPILRMIPVAGPGLTGLWCGFTGPTTSWDSTNVMG